MAHSLSNLVNNLSERIQLSLNTNRKDDKKCVISKSNISIVTIFFNAHTLKIIRMRIRNRIRMFMV